MVHSAHIICDRAASTNSMVVIKPAEYSYEPVKVDLVYQRYLRFVSMIVKHDSETDGRVHTFICRRTHSIHGYAISQMF